jgi:hypothetical protein
VSGAGRNVGPFKAAISEENLLAAIKDANATYGTGFSENPAEYAVIGVEQGTEELGVAELGEKTENLQLSTEYASLRPPTVTTTTASGVQEVQAALNGTVNPEGLEAKYHFEYGPTTSYGSSIPVPAGNAGKGEAAVPESATITGLSPGTTYHYRLSATTSAGTIHGVDEEFTTLETEVSSSWAIRNPVDGESWVYNRGSNGAIDLWDYSGVWTFSERSGHAAAAGTSPDVIRNMADGESWWSRSRCSTVVRCRGESKLWRASGRVR